MTPEHEDRSVDALLEHLDHPVPRVTVDAIVWRARRSRWSGPARAAAVLLAITIGGAAAYAIPGSPVRAWIQRAIAQVRGSPTPQPEVTQPPAADRLGIAVPPGRRLTIRFAANQDSGIASVSLTDEPNVSVTARDGAPGFTAGEETLDVDNRGSTATFDVRIPRSAASVDIEVNGVRVYTKRGDRIESGATATGVEYVIPLRGRTP